MIDLYRIFIIIPRRARSELAAMKLAYEEPVGGSLAKKVMSSSGESSQIALEAFTDGEEGALQPPYLFPSLILFLESPYIQYMDDDGGRHSSEFNFESVSYSDADEAERDNLHEYLRKVWSFNSSTWNSHTHVFHFCCFVHFGSISTNSCASA